MSEGKRSDRVADLIREEVSGMLVKSIKDPRIGFVTITRVVVSDDCRTARVYFSVVGTTAEREESTRGLNSAKGYIRKELGRRISLRYTPEIVFQFDPSIEYAIRLGEVFDHLQNDRLKEKDGEGD
jgi:ribosome-binding factor A